MGIAQAKMTEEERVAEFYARNYTWPPQKFSPDTPGWRDLMEHRLRQVAEIEDLDERYEGYIQILNSAIVAPNFTEYGFALTRAPDDLMEALRKGVRDGVAAGPRLEGDVDVIDGEQPWFIDRPDLTERVLRELQPYPEAWVDMELTPQQAYGFRLYRNNSQLHMHVDRTQTHVVSFILHIDSSDDAEPWPIVIEDFQGNTHEIVLTSGDMVFYESSKIFHGRPHRFRGTWYSSIFVHYYPKYGWQEIDHNLDRHFAVPPTWKEPSGHQFEVPLQMVGTAITEPSCPNSWCQTQYSIRREKRPVEHGKLIVPTGEELDFIPSKSTGCKDLNEKCSWWASWDTNECERNAGFMLKYCKQACRACDGLEDDMSHEL